MSECAAVVLKYKPARRRYYPEPSSHAQPLGKSTIGKCARDAKKGGRYCWQHQKWDRPLAP